MSKTYCLLKIFDKYNLIVHYVYKFSEQLLSCQGKKLKLSTKCRYGARAIFEIAKGSRNVPVKRKTIADNQGIPNSYLKNILISLKNAGIIKAIRGSNGGYVLGHPAFEITFLDIVKALEGDLNLVECLVDSSYCNRVNICSTRDIWKKMTQAHEEVLKSITVEELITKGGSSEDLNYYI